MATITQNVDTAPFWPWPFWPPRNWWLALLVILVLAGALRFPGYGFSLPHVEHVGGRADEAFYLLSARMMIDFGSAKSLNMHHYPPGILAVNYLALRFFQDPADPPTVMVGGLRLLAISISLATIVALALLGYHTVDPLAGLVAAGLWAVTPVLVEFSRYAGSDIYVAFFSILTIWLALVGALHERNRWSIGATYALMLAIIFKYSALALVPLILLAPLLNGRRALRMVAGNMGRFAIFSSWFLLLTPFLEAFQNEGMDNLAWAGILHNSLPGFTDFLAPLRSVLTELTELSLLALLPGWLGLVWLARRERRKERFALAFILLSALAWFLGMSLVQSDAVQYAIPAISLLVLLAGVGYARLLQAAALWLARTSRPRWLAVTTALLALLALNLPNAWTALNDTWQLTLPDQRNDLAVWADGSLPASKYITNYSNHRTLNSSWGGYAGETRFEYAGNPFSDTTIAEWRAQDVLFAIVPHFQYGLWREDGVHEFATQTTLLKSYPPSDAYRGPAMVVLLLHSIQHQATGKLGPIRLIGYDLPSRTASAGQSLPFHLYWQAEAATATDYQVFNHLLDAEGNLVAQTDGPPLPSERRGTMDWSDPEEIIYSRQYALALPEDLPPGEYSLVTGFYRRDNGQRLLTPTGEDSLYVTTISIE